MRKGDPIRFAANLLVPDARLTPAADFLLKYSMLGLSDVMLDAFRKAYGGLWVGGTLFLRAEGIGFQANALNRLVNAAGLDLDIPAGDIAAIEVHRAFVTGIVDLRTPEHVVSFRCWRPDRVRALARDLYLNAEGGSA